MPEKFGLVTGSTLRRYDIDRYRRENNRFQIVMNSCKNYHENDVMFMRFIDLPYSLNKQRRWEILEQMPVKSAKNNFFYNKERLLEFLRLDGYEKFQGKINVNLAVKLQEGQYWNICFKFHNYHVINGMLAQSSWDTKLNCHIMMSRIKNELEETHFKLLAAKNIKEKRQKRKSKNSKHYEPQNNDVELDYTIYWPNIMRSLNTKYGVNYRKFFKKRQKKKRVKVCPLDYENYDEEYYCEDENFIEQNIDLKADESDWCVVTPNDLDEFEYIIESSDEFENITINNDANQTRKEEKFCLFDYLTTKPKRSKKYRKQKYQNESMT